MKRLMIGAALRQACFGLLAVALSLPLLWTFHRAMGVGSPSAGSVLLLGASVVAAFVGGGLLGAALREFGRGTRFERGRGRGWIAPLAGLLFGLFFSIAVGSFYGQSIVEDLAGEGAKRVWSQRDKLWNQPRATTTDAARELVWQGVSRLPILILLGWAIIGPPFSAALEYRPAAISPGGAALRRKLFALGSSQGNQ